MPNNNDGTPFNVGMAENTGTPDNISMPVNVSMHYNVLHFDKLVAVTAVYSTYLHQFIHAINISYISTQRISKFLTP